MLKDEIEKAQRLVKTDAYQMSIGEVVNMYKDQEFIINPDFQRLFRWDIGQNQLRHGLETKALVILRLAQDHTACCIQGPQCL